MKSIRLSTTHLLQLSSILFILCTVIPNFSPAFAQESPGEGEWIQLLMQDTEGWTPKFRGSEYGENYKNTFQVKDGVIRVSYDEYEEFDNRFGHLFYRDSFSNYILRVEYRFVGEQCPGGPSWAIRNSGAMLHCQDPKTMSVEQEFPVSIEAQLLGGLGEVKRTTGNLCTPGTNVVMNGELITQHCNGSVRKPIMATSGLRQFSTWRRYDQTQNQR